MKLGAVTKLDKRNTIASKNDVILENYDGIVIFPVYG